MLKKFNTLISTLKSMTILVQWALSVLGFASFSAIFVYLTEWLKPYGAIGYFVVIMIGSSIGIFTFLIFALGKYYLAKQRAINAWAEKSDLINPLDKSFTDKRIKISDLVSPIDGAIDGKSINNCELIGPANILIAEGSSLVGNSLGQVDFVKIRMDLESMYNVVPFKRCTITGCKLKSITIFIRDPIPPDFLIDHANWVTER